MVPNFALTDISKWTIGKRVLNRILVVDRPAQPNSFDGLVTLASGQKASILGLNQFERDKPLVYFTNLKGYR
jgi:hypothetical protein